MTHYYFNSATNTFHGPIEKEPKHSDCLWCGCFDCVVLRGVIHHAPSHPHRFTGESRVVREDEVEWRHEMTTWKKEVWHRCSIEAYSNTKDEARRRVAVPKSSGEHKCQYCGAMTTQPDEQCWNNPKYYQFAEGEDDIAFDYHEANQNIPPPNLDKSTANLSKIKDKDSWLREVRGEDGDPFIEKHLAIIKTKMKQNQEVIKKAGELIDKHIKPLFNGLQKASVEYFVEKGTISGAFYEALTSMVIEAMPEPITDQPDKQENMTILQQFYKFKEENPDAGTLDYYCAGHQHAAKPDKQREEALPPNSGEYVEALKKLLRLADCPESLIDNPFIFGKPTTEDIEWAKGVFEKYKSIPNDQKFVVEFSDLKSYQDFKAWQKQQPPLPASTEQIAALFTKQPTATEGD